MNRLKEIEKLYDHALTEQRFAMDHLLWCDLYAKKLLSIAKAAKYLTDRTDNYYLHAEIKDPLMQNLRKKLKELEKG